MPPTRGDFHQLEQVFLNILNNAVDAIGDASSPGEIWIRTAADGDCLRVEFTDNGPGVSNPHRIFDPFYTTKPVGKGTGLGLSICYGIVKEHGGEIQVRNSPPRGATFTITLPLLPVEGAPATKGTAPVASFSGTVLLAESEESVLQVEREVLSGAGGSIRVARSTREAIDILERESIDAVVAEADTSGASSSQSLYHWIEANRPELFGRIVLTTSQPGDQLPSGFHNAGFVLLRKPFPPQKLCETVRGILAIPVASASKS
jgi:two-component system, NtrC family, sensor kinase